MKNKRNLPVVVFRGMQYTMDIPVCRRALVRRQVAGDFDSMDGLAKLCDISRSTASRFFSARMSLPVALMILGKLQLDFDDVFSPYNADGDGCGESCSPAQ